MNDKHLITADELRAAGALDVPPAWRTSLGVERECVLNFMLDEDDAETPLEPEEDEPASTAPDDEGESG